MTSWNSNTSYAPPLLPLYIVVAIHGPNGKASRYDEFGTEKAALEFAAELAATALWEQVNVYRAPDPRRWSDTLPIRIHFRQPKLLEAER